MTTWGRWGRACWGRTWGKASVAPVVEAVAPLYAQTGERVTCTAGHHICTVGIDIRKGDFQKPEHFVDWCFGEAPTPGVPVPPPCQCGAIWYRSIPEYAFQFHFETGGWR